MIGHDLKNVDFNIRESPWQGPPHSFDHLPGIVDDHFPIADLPEKILASLRHNGDKISARQGIIIFFQANGMPVQWIRWLHSSSRKQTRHLRRVRLLQEGSPTRVN